MWVSEAKSLASLAWPVIATNVGLYSMGLVDILMVGHLGTLELSAAALGNMWSGGTAFIALGCATALDTLVSQAHGSGNHRLKVATLRQAYVVMTVLSVAIAPLWFFGAPILALLNQPEEILGLTQTFTRHVWPCTQ